MLLEREEKVRFLSKEDERQEKPDDTFDFFLYSALQDSRQLMIETLQNRDESISFRMAKVLALAHDIQNRIDTRRIFEVEELLERYRRPGADEGLKRKFQACQDQKKAECFWQSLPDLMGELETLDTVWRSRADERLRRLGNHSASEMIAKEQLMVYFIYTYFCGAVYDGDACSKVKMSIVSTLLIDRLWETTRLEKKRELTLEECAEIVWSFSRELEHSDLNLNHMEEMMQTKKTTSFEYLLSAVLSDLRKL
jgi:lysine-N-methylase